MAGPPEREVKDFRFKHLLKFRVSSLPEDVTKKRLNLIAVSNKYGLSFIGTGNGFRVLRTSDIITKAAEVGKASANVVEDMPFWKTVQLQSSPMYVGLSSDGLTLAVCIEKSQFPFALMYDVRAFADQNGAVGPFLEVKLCGSPGTHLQDAMWNPGSDYPSLFAAAISDGSLALWGIKDCVTCVATLPMTANVTCLCWSPKGKQLLAGHMDGSFIQYDQTLNEKKKVPPPIGLFGGKPISVLDVIWESTYVYIAAFVPAHNPDMDQPSLVYVSCPKVSPVSYVDFEDVCFGGGSNRPHKYYFNMLVDWKLILVSSANALEAALLGKNPANEAVWERWSLEDSGRAELPMTSDYVETYPAGIAIDVTSQNPIIIDDTQTHPASPIFMMLSTEGVLSTFHMIDCRQTTPTLQRPVEPLQSTGARIPLVYSMPKVPAQASTQPAAQPPPPPAYGQMSFGQTQLSQPTAQPSALAPPQASTPKARTNLFGLLNQGDAQGSSLFGKPTGASKNLFGPAHTASQDPKLGRETDSQTLGVGMLHSTADQGSTSGQGVFGQPASSSGANTSLLGLTNIGEFSFKSATQNAEQKPAAAFTSTPQMTSQGQKPVAAFSNNPTAATAVAPKPAPAFPTTLPAINLSAHAQSPTIQKPAPSVAQPTGFSFSSTPQNPVSIGGSIAPPNAGVAKPEPTAQVARNVGFTPVNGTPKKAMSAFAMGSKTADQSASITQRTQPTTAQSTPVKEPPAANEGPKTPGSGRKRGHVVDDPFMKTILEEIQHFRQELRDLKTRSSGLSYDIGSREEISQLRQNTNEMSSFCGEIKATTQSLNEDIHELKHQCLEGFATLEECNKRQECYQDDSYHFLLGSRALDPMSERKLREIQTHYQYLDAGIRDVDLKLDAEWDSYQRSKNINKSMQTPATDMIYRTLTNNQKIVDTYNHTISTLTSQLTNLRMYNTATQWSSANHGQLVGRIASPLEKLSAERVGPEVTSSVYTPRTLGQRTNRMNQLNRSNLSESSVGSMVSPQQAAAHPISPEKQHKLQQVLSQRRVTPVKATAPANLSMSRVVSAELLREMTRRETLQESYLDSVSEQDNVENMQPVVTSSQKQMTAKQIAAPSAIDQTKKGVEMKASRKAQPGGFNGLALKPKAQSVPTIDKHSKPVSLFGNTATAGFTSAKSTAFTSVLRATPPGDQGQTKRVLVEAVSSTQNVNKPGGISQKTAVVSKTSSPAGFTFNTTSSKLQNQGFSFSNQAMPTFGQSKSPDVSGSRATVTSSAGDSPNSDYSEVSSGTTTSGDTLEGSSGSGDSLHAVTGMRTPPPADISCETVIEKTPVQEQNKRHAPSAAGFSVTSSQPNNASADTSSQFGSVQQAKATPPGGATFVKQVETTSSSGTPKAAGFAFGPGLSSTGSMGSGSFNFGGEPAGGAPSMGFSFGKTAGTNTSSSSDTSTVASSSNVTPASSGFSFNAARATTSTPTGFSFQPTGATSALGTPSQDISAKNDTSSKSIFGVNSTTATSIFGGGDANAATSFAFTSKPEVTTVAPTQSTTIEPDSKAAIKPGSSSAAVDLTLTSRTELPAGNNTQQLGSAIKGLLGDAPSATQLVQSTGSTPATPDGTQERPSTQTGTQKQPPMSTPSGTQRQQLLSTLITQSAPNIPKVHSAPAIASTLSISNTQGALTTEVSSGTHAVPSTTVASVVASVPVAVVQSTDLTSTTGQSSIATQNISKVLDTTAPSTDTQAIPSSTVTTTAPVVATATSVAPASDDANQNVTSLGFDTTKIHPAFGTPTAAQSVFGVAATPSTFGTAATSGTPAAFGGTATISSTPGAFGGTATISSPPAAFGGTATTGLFGAAPTTPPPGQLFGQSAQPSTEPTQLFGQSTGQPAITPATPLFGQTSVESTPPTNSQAAPVFGQSTVSSSGFGAGGATSVFGAPSASTGGNLFGQPVATTATFGGFGQQSPFGQTSAPSFGQQVSSSGSVFGGNTSTQQTTTGAGVFGNGGGVFGLGGKPSAENVNKNVFGGGTFGAPTAAPQTQGLFANGGGGFGTQAQIGGGFASPSGGGFTAGGGGVGSTGFGGFGVAPQSPQSAGGFGGRPAFGATSSFGASPSFGSAPAFGSPPGMGGGTFGGGAVFASNGASQPTAPSGFAGFANASAPSFGGIAQQSGAPTFGAVPQQQQQQQQQPQNTGFGNPGAFGSTGGFGNTNQPSSFGQGGSFSSYR